MGFALVVFQKQGGKPFPEDDLEQAAQKVVLGHDSVINEIAQDPTPVSWNRSPAIGSPPDCLRTCT